jgi:hypothetical protein
MRKDQLNSRDSTSQLNRKDKYEIQTRRVFDAFLEKPKTMMMVSVETGIMRSNITLYVANWKKQNLIEVIRLGKCPITIKSCVQFLQMKEV